MPKSQRPANFNYISAVLVFVALLATGVFNCCLANDTTAKAAIDANKQPLVVFIYSRECPVCAKVRPVVAEIAREFKSKAKFVDLDVTDDKTTQQSRQTAKQLQLRSFFALYQDTFPCVGIFDSKKKCIKELFGANSKQTYESFINKVIAQSH